MAASRRQPFPLADRRWPDEAVAAFAQTPVAQLVRANCSPSRRVVELAVGGGFWNCARRGLPRYTAHDAKGGKGEPDALVMLSDSPVTDHTAPHDIDFGHHHVEGLARAQVAHHITNRRVLRMHMGEIENHWSPLLRAWQTIVIYPLGASYMKGAWLPTLQSHRRTLFEFEDSFGG